MGNMYSFYDNTMFDIHCLYNAILAYGGPKINLPHKLYPIPGITANFPISRGTVSGTVFNTNLSQCHIEVFAVSDTLYPIRTRVKFTIDNDGSWDTENGPYEVIGEESEAYPIGQSALFTPPILAVVRMNEDTELGTPQTLASTYKPNGLVRSYDTSYDTIFDYRTYMYDQALAIITACIMNDPINAKAFSDALVSVQKLDGRWPFHVNTISKHCDDNYYRTGTIMFCIYALGFYLRKFPSGDPNGIIKSSIQKSMHCMIDKYLVTTSGDMRQGLFKGGKGQYVQIDGNEVFDPLYHAEWCANEHNVDAYFALDLLIKLDLSIPNTSYDYTIIQNNLLSTMMDVMWDNELNRSRQAIQDAITPSPYNTLDCNTWYAALCISCGQLERAIICMENAEKWYRYSGVISDTNLQVSGYRMYSELSDISESLHVWGEGTAGGVLACKLLVQALNNPLKKISYSKKANNLLTGYQYMNDPTSHYGIKYTSNHDDNDWFCISSTAWTIISIMGKGFWGLS
jgi:hypothetical protein